MPNIEFLFFRAELGVPNFDDEGEPLTELDGDEVGKGFKERLTGVDGALGKDVDVEVGVARPLGIACTESSADEGETDIAGVSDRSPDSASPGGEQTISFGEASLSTTKSFPWSEGAAVTSGTFSCGVRTVSGISWSACGMLGTSATTTNDFSVSAEGSENELDSCT